MSAVLCMVSQMGWTLKVICEESSIEKVVFMQLTEEMPKHLLLIANFTGLTLTHLKSVLNQTNQRSIILLLLGMFIPLKSDLPTQIHNLLVIMIQLTDRTDATSHNIPLQLQTMTNQFKFSRRTQILPCIDIDPQTKVLLAVLKIRFQNHLLDQVLLDLAVAEGIEI